MRMIILGPPGSGKSDLAQKIADQYKLPILNLTALLTDLSEQDTDLGRIVAELLIACAPVPEELINTALKERLEMNREGFILDDFPRESQHYDTLHALLLKVGAPLELALHVNVHNDIILERLVGYLNCNVCGEEYNIYTTPPLVEGICDVCGSRMARRPPDYEETLANRLRQCEVHISDLVKRYEKDGVLRQVMGMASEEPAAEQAFIIIDETPRKSLTEPMDEIPPEAMPQRKRRGRKPKKLIEAENAAILAEAEKEKAEAKKAAKKRAKKKSAKKKAGPKRKSSPKKAAVKKKITKKATKKKIVKKAASKKKSAVKKKATATKKVVKKTATKKKSAAKKKVTTKRKSSPKKGIKKTAAKKKAAKKVTTKKKTVKKSPVKKKAMRKVAKKKTARTS